MVASKFLHTDRFSSTTLHQSGTIRHTSPVHDFLGVARQRDSPILGIQVKLFCSRAKMFDEGSEHAGINSPFVLCRILVE